MNKINTILQITSEILDRYRNSIPRKAFIRAMERVMDCTLGPGEQMLQVAYPGMQLNRDAEVSDELIAQLLSGACPPFSRQSTDFDCKEYDCHVCWRAWLTTGMPPQKEE